MWIRKVQSNVLLCACTMYVAGIYMYTYDYVVVQFYLGVNVIFLLFQTRYHTLPYPKTMGNKSKPRMKLNYNMHMMCHLQLIFQALRIEN